MLLSGDVTRCENRIASTLAALPRSPFHIALALSISTKPEMVADWFDRFFEQQKARFEIGAAYTELNGFSINPGLWFCDAFAYQEYGGLEDYDWLSSWQSDRFDSLVIEGLEALQAVYASDAFRDERFSDACAVTELLVVIKFQDLIRRSAPLMKRLNFPLLATAHDYDFIYEVRKNA